LDTLPPPRGIHVAMSCHEMKPTGSIEELRVHTETDVDGVGRQADADTDRLAEEDVESAEERRRSAYRLT
jgi:hypothetical protein